MRVHTMSVLPPVSTTSAPTLVIQIPVEKAEARAAPYPVALKYIAYPFWVVWVAATSVVCCPLLLCTAMGECERDSGGNPTYPTPLAEMQCCRTMCCDCTKGY
jgi:hypothetical protein